MKRAHPLWTLAGRRPLLLSHVRCSRVRAAGPAPPSSVRNLVVLGIETSADDTCAALLRVTGHGAQRIATTLCEDRISCPNSRLRGIQPYDAVVSHTQHLSPMIQRIMQSPSASTTSAPPQPTPDLIAVTRGPGMGACLSVGVTTAKALAVAWSVPIVGVHHMQAHALTPMMEAALARGAQNPPPSTTTEANEANGPQFPFLTLLISGKHTMLVHTKSHTDHKILASADTVALGDVLDKCAREILPDSMLPANAAGSGADVPIVYPKLMESFVADAPQVLHYIPPPEKTRFAPIYTSLQHGWTITPPHRSAPDALTFDFTGFGGHIRKLRRARPDMAEAELKELALQTMQLAFEYVVRKVVLALRTVPDLVAQPPSTLVLSGGVASNLFLRTVAETTLAARGFGGIRVLAPAPRYCTDNAPMIAFAGAQMYQEEGWTTDLGFTPKIKWSLEGILSDTDCWVRRPGF